jgi:hypothetical protein
LLLLRDKVRILAESGGKNRVLLQKREVRGFLENLQHSGFLCGYGLGQRLKDFWQSRAGDTVGVRKVLILFLTQGEGSASQPIRRVFLGLNFCVLPRNNAKK